MNMSLESPIQTLLIGRCMSSKKRRHPIVYSLDRLPTPYIRWFAIQSRLLRTCLLVDLSQ